MSAVIRLGYVHLRVTDLEEARNHYSNTSAWRWCTRSPADCGSRAGTSGTTTRSCSRKAGSGWSSSATRSKTSTTWPTTRRRAQQFGVTLRRFSAGENLKVGDGVRITLPSEHTLELYTDMEFAGTEIGAINPEAWPRHVRGVGTPLDRPRPDRRRGTRARRPVHVASAWTSTPPNGPWRASSDPNLLGSWMTCGESPHDLAFIKGPNNKLHHFAFHLEDWSSRSCRAGDLFSMDDVPIDIGPTRHGITRGKTIYFFDPSGNRNEVFAGRLPRPTPTARPSPGPPTSSAKGIFYHARELNERFTTVFT